MFPKLLSTEAALRRHRDAPFAQERERYLQHCADLGATYATLRHKSTELLWVARLLHPSAPQGVSPEQLQEIVRRRIAVHKGVTTARRVVDIARPWFRFLGWWHAPAVEIPFQNHLDCYVRWLRDERGLSSSTVEQWQRRARLFLQWCAATNRQLCHLVSGDIDHYFISEAAQGWSRVSAANIATALRVFLRHAAMQGTCDARLAETIRGPRVYEQESLPFAPGWPDVRRMLADMGTDRPRDVRDRAILMLLAIYGMRRSEVASLRLDQVDWRERVLRLFRLKRRQAQVYPLLPSVAAALSRYIDTVRPPTPHQQVFVGLQSPRRPMSPASIYHVVSRRFKSLGIQRARCGPHALRHACAARLVAEGLTLKEIGDHLGHRSVSATRTYAKVDLRALHEVGDFDLGDLQ
jgi:integrase/recombinase XerD